METHTVPPEIAAALLAAGYRVGGPAGVGGGGPVWTATRLDDRGEGPGRRTPVGGTERVVVQVVDAPTGTDGDLLAARVSALRSSDHPHLARVVDVLEVAPAAAGRPGRSAVLFAEVPGATVAALLAARGRLSVGEVVTLVVPVAGALDALHRTGLVHGDVSPANVVVRPDGRPVLIDLLGGARPDAGARGTPGFVAPELLRGRADADVRQATGPEGLPADAPADVFALASVGLAALDLSATGARLGQELTAACAPDPLRRPSAAELAAVVYPCAQPEPIALPDAGVLARAALAQLAAEPRTVSAGADPATARVGRPAAVHRAVRGSCWSVRRPRRCAWSPSGRSSGTALCRTSPRRGCPRRPRPPGAGRAPRPRSPRSRTTRSPRRSR
ncbi:protein kinase domain-containing protein [Cellulomonas sp. ATA003]|uniref:protein kinase domain-containing protein n=1 Tax=Cellulomonas sp. ATA003 TaxID=3073064 RepID=UPI002873768D|nr:hypothetical protein [Cellulomonas sp. ATA003]WNB84481.1 hypothetical protein REH70_11590 [Cellulomonas sp. ATA003]